MDVTSLREGEGYRGVVESEEWREGRGE